MNRTHYLYTLSVILVVAVVVGVVWLSRTSVPAAVEAFSVPPKHSQQQEQRRKRVSRQPNKYNNDFSLHHLHTVQDLPNLFKKESKTCKFFPSINNNFKCPASHPFNTGASFGFDSDNITCNGKSIRLQRAKAYAVLKNRKVHKIQIIKPGEHYREPPRIVIVGDCTRKATAYATVSSQGTIDQIVITDPGYGYTSTPKVHISKPNATLQCNMCCQVDKRTKSR